ncbi:MAG: ankyrin repeat domain-containing protein [Candidatus Aminicenantes bacterium]|nr:ankyrin repeat domain-containing protein [Candidatus Aminicenantes bacterium]
MRNRSGFCFKPGSGYINRFFIICVTLALFAISACVDGMHQAAETGNLKKLETLLKEDPALINEKDSYGMTPLHWAVDKGHRRTAEFLIEKGADVNAKDKIGETPLRYAVSKEYSSMATMLILNGAKVSTKEEDVRDMLKRIAPLHRVASDGQLGNVKTFLEKYPDQVNARDNLGRTPLYWAARAEHIEVCEYLLSHGADINAANPDGWTPLHTSVYNRRTRSVELLVAQGADVNVKNNDGETPLHWAARRGRKDLIEPLIAKGADVNAKDNNGKTPVDWTEHKDIIELLRSLN